MVDGLVGPAICVDAHGVALVAGHDLVAAFFTTWPQLRNGPSASEYFGLLSQNFFIVSKENNLMFSSESHLPLQQISASAGLNPEL